MPFGAETMHTVVQGEYISLLASRYGFVDYRTIWDHPKNARLKALRKNPSVLHPGDEVYIPAREPKEEPRPTDQRHRFQVRRTTLRLRVVFDEFYYRPLDQTPCELHLASEVRSLTTDDRGRIDQEIPMETQDGILVLKPATGPVEHVPFRLGVGRLDPVEERSGQVKRLSNLGYYRTPVEEFDAREFRSAVEEFQCDSGLAVDGICGPATQAKLKDVHGC
jgi:hypothetical protein